MAAYPGRLQAEGHAAADLLVFFIRHTPLCEYLGRILPILRIDRGTRAVCDGDFLRNVLWGYPCDLCAVNHKKSWVRPRTDENGHVSLAVCCDCDRSLSASRPM